ncbi:MAG: group III truncated hemoglobin [Chitinophagaceae bacterium]
MATDAPKNDIHSIEDIQLLVNTFYERIRTDALLGGIFNGVIGDRWPQHLEKMYRFWQTVLLEEHTYNGRPFPPHAELPVRAEHFERWLQLWHETVDRFFTGPLALDAKERGNKMAALFFSKIEYYRNSNAKPLF